MNHAVIKACLPWLLTLVAGVVAAALAVRASGARLQLGRLRSLSRDQNGAVQSLSFVLTLPIFMMIMLFILQISQVLIGTIVVHYAAFAAARSAIVWIPTRLEPFDPQDDPQFATYGPYLRANQMGPTLIDRGGAPGGTLYEIGPGTPKYQQIQTAAALACVSISPSRKTSAGASGLAPSTSAMLHAVYRSLAPLAAANPQVNVRMRNKLGYALANTQVKVNFVHKSDEPPLGHYYIRSATGNDDQAFFFWEVGWQDPVTVTVTHQFALLPGPGRFLSKPTPTASGQEDFLSPKIRQRGSDYVYPITATVTLGNEGEKSVLPKVEQIPGGGM